jgi:F0F1-type ATP synthase membrane subunit b/b'
MRTTVRIDKSLLEQARREIEIQLKVAERELVRLAADLAIAVAAERVRNTITAADQRRLVDLYVSSVAGGK